MQYPIPTHGDALPDRHAGDARFAEAPMLSVADYLAIIRRRKWSLILPAAGLFLLSVVVALALPPIYKSTATILIEEQEIPQDFVTATITSYAEQRIQTINQRIMSSSRLLEVINRLGLYQHLRDRRTTDEIVAQMREDVSLEPVSAEVMDRRTGKTQEATIAFTLSFEGKESPEMVQNVASQLTSLLLEENLRVRERQVEETSKFLEEEAARVKATLDDLEARIAEYKTRHIDHLPELLPANIQTLERIERSITMYNEQLQTLKEREGYLSAQLAVTPREWDKSWRVEKDEDMKRLEYLEVQLVSLKTNYSDAYPDVYKTRQEIDRLRAMLNLPPYPAPIKTEEEKESAENPAYINLAAQLSGTRAEIGTIERQIQNLEAKTDDYRRRIEATPRVEEEYNQLMAERDNNRAKHNDLLQKFMEARVAQGLEKEQKGERFTLIDPARLPEKPYKPNRLAIVLIGVVLGIGAGVGFAALREFTDNAVYSPEELTRLTGCPVLAGVPVIVTEAERKRRRQVKHAAVIALVVLMVVAPVLFHFLVMDLDLVWAKIMRRLAF
jgi:polysaccharide chain length determinant protein (PEP-CTERM system associated)